MKMQNVSKNMLNCISEYLNPIDKLNFYFISSNLTQYYLKQNYNPQVMRFLKTFKIPQKKKAKYLDLTLQAVKKRFNMDNQAKGVIEYFLYYHLYSEISK